MQLLPIKKPPLHCGNFSLTSCEGCGQTEKLSILDFLLKQISTQKRTQRANYGAKIISIFWQGVSHTWQQLQKTTAPFERKKIPRLLFAAVGRANPFILWPPPPPPQLPPQLDSHYRHPSSPLPSPHTAVHCTAITATATKAPLL